MLEESECGHAGGGRQCDTTLDDFSFSVSDHRDAGLFSALLSSEGLAQCIQKSNSLTSFS